MKRIAQQIAGWWLLIFLAGCGSLPVMVPDMALDKPRAIHLEGARGPLSAQRSKAILDGLKSRSQETNVLDRHLALEEAIVGSPLVVGNKVTLLLDGMSTYDAMFAAIKDAKDHINMETYIIEDDEIGQKFAAALIEKQLEGVQVNLMYDSVGSLLTPREYFKHLTDKGINVLEFNPINPIAVRKGWDVNQRDHRKLLVVDGKVAFVGGINISSVYSSGSFRSRQKKKILMHEQDGPPWRDTHLRMEGPVVAEFQKLFMESWAGQHGSPLAPKNYFPQLSNQGKEVVRAIGSSPDEPYGLNYATLISAINSAESQVYLTNAYFVPDPQMLTALKDAVRRGVEVKLLLPGRSDSAMVSYASHSYYDELLRSGIKIYVMQDALLHAKTALIDGVWSTVGSTNLDWRSFLYNQEIDAVVLGQDFGAKMRAVFEKDVAKSLPVTLEQWRQRSVFARFKEMGARLWAHLL
ncbi:MAG: cardiolipin synthase [Pseudomonadota bacterium]